MYFVFLYVFLCFFGVQNLVNACASVHFLCVYVRVSRKWWI